MDNKFKKSRGFAQEAVLAVVLFVVLLGVGGTPTVTAATYRGDHFVVRDWEFTKVTSRELPQANSGERIEKARCNDDYCLVTISTYGEFFKLLRVDKDDSFIDLSEKINSIMSASERTLKDYQWNGNYWLFLIIGQNSTCYSFDGESFSLVNREGWRTNAAFSWNGTVWGTSRRDDIIYLHEVSIPPQYGNSRTGYFLNGQKTEEPLAVLWGGSTWLIFYEETARGTSRRPKIYSISFGSDPFRPYYPYLENIGKKIGLEKYNKYQFHSVLQTGISWYALMSDTETGKKKILFQSNGQLRDVTKSYVQKPNQEPKVIGGRQGLFAVAFGDEKEQSNLEIVVKRKHFRIPNISKHAITSITSQGDELLVTTTEEVWRVKQVSK